MKRFKIGVNGTWYDIEIKDLDASPISVLVDGELHQVELGPEIPDAKDVGRGAGEPGVSVSESTLGASGPALRPTQEEPQKVAAAGGEVIAPMPGKILTVNVRVGDRVKHKDVLCILEAMKMENEIMSSGGGVVREIRVAERQDVLYGDVLFLIE